MLLYQLMELVFKFHPAKKAEFRKCNYINNVVCFFIFIFFANIALHFKKVPQLPVFKLEFLGFTPVLFQQFVTFLVLL